MKKSIVSLAIFTIVVNGFSQEIPPKNTLTFSAGFSHLTRQDLVFSPFIHRDVSAINIRLGYARSGKLYQQVNLRYTNFAPMLVDPYPFFDLGEQKTAGPHNFTWLDIDYLLGKKIIQKGKSSATFGGLISADIQLLNYVYGRIGNTGYVFSFGLGPFIKYDYQISDKNKVSAKLQLPLAYWLARSPYLVNDDTYIENISSHSDLKSFGAFIGDGSFATLNEIQTFDLNLEYLYTLSPKWKLGADYHLAFQHVRSPRMLLSFQNSLYFSANFIF
jgi:hypothetical protein